MSVKEMEHTYLGLTIGPIVKTLMNARKTRHLWAASYTFAYLMKEIAHEFNQLYPGRTWYKPFLGDTALDTFEAAGKRKNKLLSNTGVGIFPDHLILSSTLESDLEELRKIAVKVIESYSTSLAGALDEAADAQAVKDFLLDYFQIHIVQKKIPENANPILEINKVLNVVELQQAFATEKASFLTTFFDQVTDSFLTKDAFGKKHNFASIPEISLVTHLQSELRNQDNRTCRDFVNSKVRDGIEEDEEKYVEWVKTFLAGIKKDDPKQATTFFTGQKYIAIVQMDGDSIGALLKELPQDKLASFSEKLTDFAVEAADLVQAYDGMPVYFGGDDALFFAPVLHGEKNVFELLRAMNEAFKKKFEVFPEANSPSLSFGVSITYLKFPLYEALDHSGNLLRGPAKAGFLSDEKDPKTGKLIRKKNNIAFRILKHSGSTFGGLIHLNDQAAWSSLEAFLEVLDQNTRFPGEALRSITYRIPENKVLLQIIGKDRDALRNFLDNSFDEDVHADRETYISAVANLIHNVYLNHERYPAKEDKKTFGSPDRISYNLLKAIAFLTTLEN